MDWRNSLTNQKIKTKFVGREVKANITDLAGHMFGEGHVDPYALYEDFYNYEVSAICSACGEDVDDGDEYCSNCGAALPVFPDQRYSEPLEFYIVSEFLGTKLEKYGEMVLPRMFGWIWGRQCSGQAIMLDSVIDDICDELGLLKKPDKEDDYE